MLVFLADFEGLLYGGCSLESYYLNCILHGHVSVTGDGQPAPPLLTADFPCVDGG